MNLNKIVKNIFLVFVCLSVSAALWVFKDLLFPYVTSKAFFFRIAVELAFPLYLFLILRDPSLRPSKKNPLHIFMLGFLVINIVSSFTGVSVVRSLFGNFERMGGAYYIAHLTALYFYIVALGQMQGLYLLRFIKFLLLMALVVAGNGIFGWLGLPTFVQDPSLPVRVSSSLGNPIYLGSYLIIPLFLAIFLTVQAESIFSKFWYWMLGFIFLFGIYLSGTRGAVVGIILGSFISFLVYLFFAKNNKIRRLGIFAVLVLIFAVGALMKFSDKLPSGSTIQRLVKLRDSNSQSRILQWKIALKGFPERPLLGTGPENYYVVANKYYDQEVFKHDRSWFDKPHNYILEILVTNGVFGLIAYVGVIILSIWALFKAYKADFYGLFEFCVLLTAALAYQIQNLFVFDTVPASLTFFSFVGFAGFLWGISSNVKKESIKSSHYLNNFAVAVLGVSFVIIFYLVYVSNIYPMRVAKNVNYGYAYASVDTNRAANYFETAVTLPFNFDKTETASKYGDFASILARGSNEKNSGFALQILDKSINYMNYAIETQPDNPILWQRLSTLYLYKTSQVGNRIIVDPRAEDAVKKAVELAPMREESYVSRAQLQSIKGNLIEAQKILEEAVKLFPTDYNLKVQLATLFRAQNKIKEAVAVIETALTEGYVFPSYNDSKWLIDYYMSAKDFEKAIIITEKFAKSETSNIQIFMDLAYLYGVVGRTAEAKNIAQSIMNFDPSKKPEMQKLLDSLGVIASTTPVK